MVQNKPTIYFTAIYYNEEFNIQTYEGEYRNLMVLIRDKIYTEEFGECNGMGRCGTCLVKLTNVETDSFLMDRNEKTTLTKMRIDDPLIHLSCQIAITNELNNVIVSIL